MGKGKTFGAFSENCYKWEISVIDLETNIETTDRYFSIKHFNDLHNTKYTSDTVQKLRKLREKMGSIRIEDIKNAQKRIPCSVLAKYGHLHFISINKPIIYELVSSKTHRTIY